MTCAEVRLRRFFVATFLWESQTTFLVPEPNRLGNRLTFDHDKMNATAFELVGLATTGSLMAELVVAYRILSRGRNLPARYQTWSFYWIRGGMAVGAGVLPLVFGVEDARCAFALGVLAPVVIDRIPGIATALLNSIGCAQDGKPTAPGSGAKRSAGKTKRRGKNR